MALAASAAEEMVKRMATERATAIDIPNLKVESLFVLGM